MMKTGRKEDSQPSTVSPAKVAKPHHGGAVAELFFSSFSDLKFELDVDVVKREKG
jgi:hypothetical protein